MSDEQPHAVIWLEPKCDCNYETGQQWCEANIGCEECGRDWIKYELATPAQEPFPQPDRNRAGKEPCGECHIQPGETCDICGASQPATPAQEPDRD